MACKAVDVKEMCGWQFGKSLTQCNRFMLDNQMMTDVCFEVGFPEAARGVIRAHKYVLVSRSTVFEAMFCRKGAFDMKDVETPETKLQINDMEASVFKEVISFIYTDEATVNPNNALTLLYAAKKYLIADLIVKCQKCLQDNLAAENVCMVLDQCLTIGEQELKEHCIEWIGANSKDSVSSPAFLSLSGNALEILIGSDTLRMSEWNVHASCVEWAKSQLKLSEIEMPTDGQIREKLGNILYRIRYPVLTAEKFAQLIGKSGLLTDKEKSSIYYSIALNEQDENLMFDFKPRPLEYVVERFSGVSVVPWNNYGYQNHNDGIQLTSNKDVFLTGVGIYMGHGAGDFDVTITVQNAQGVVFSKVKSTVHSDGVSQIIKVKFDKKIAIQAGTVYTVWTAPMQMHTGHSYGCFGNAGKPTCTANNVVFTFSAYGNSPYTTVNQGQLPQFYFENE